MLSEQPWYRQAKENKGQTVISSSHVQPVIKGEYRWVVSLSRELSGVNSSNGLGILLIDLNFKVINDMLSKLDLGNRGYVFVIDRHGRIVYHPQQQLLYSNLKTERLEQVLQDKQGGFVVKEGGASRIYSIKDTDFGWKIVGVFTRMSWWTIRSRCSFCYSGVVMPWRRRAVLRRYLPQPDASHQEAPG